MKLKKQSLQELRDIVAKDYGVVLTDENASEFGVDLLRLTRVGLAALARAGDKRSSAEARESASLESNTSG